MAIAPPIPTLLAFIVCDTVIQDSATQKKTLVGIFHQIAAPKFPLVMPQLGLYAKMVEGQGKYSFRVRLVNLKEEALIFEMGVEGVEWKDGDAPMDIGINLNGGVQIPEVGNYEFQLLANDIYLGRTVVNAFKLELPPGGPTPR